MFQDAIDTGVNVDDEEELVDLPVHMIMIKLRRGTFFKSLFVRFATRTHPNQITTSPFVLIQTLFSFLLYVTIFIISHLSLPPPLPLSPSPPLPLSPSPSSFRCAESDVIEDRDENILHLNFSRSFFGPNPPPNLISLRDSFDPFVGQHLEQGWKIIKVQFVDAMTVYDATETLDLAVTI